MESIRDTLTKYWGYDSFLPLQQEAMECVSRGRDSIVVLPTGGGKSLCFQAPALTMPGLAIVVSPLLSLMKDQVDALRESGVAAARIDSTQSISERETVLSRIHNKTLKLLYLSPESLLNEPNQLQPNIWLSTLSERKSVILVPGWMSKRLVVLWMPRGRLEIAG